MTFDADKLRALDEAATPGPWKVFAMFGDGGPQEVCRADDYAMGGVCVPHRKDDAALIANLRNSVPAILAMAEDRKRSEKHRNDLADKITEQSVEIGALKADIERHLSALSAEAEENKRIREALETISTITGKGAHREIARRALGKDKA